MTFSHYTDADAIVVGVLPSGGFLFESRVDEEDGTHSLSVEPVIGWAVLASGHTEALVLGDNGVAEPISVACPGRVFHPDHPDTRYHVPELDGPAPKQKQKDR